MKRLFAALALLSACAEDPLDAGQLPPPGNTQAFVVSQIMPGSPFRLTWGDLPAGTRVTFAASAQGLGQGPCPPILGGACLGIRNPTVIGTATAGANMAASLIRPAPANLPPGSYHFQAVAVLPNGQALLSEPWERFTGPGFCPLNFDPVCGYDGTTYSNECGAHSVGMAVKDWGACP